MTHRLLISIALCTALLGGCMEPQDNGDTFFVFKDKKLSPAKDGTPQTFHVRGHMRDGKFIPNGQVTGDEPLDKSGRLGWMEIPSGKFYSMTTARTPLSPYVRGYMTDHGFVPSSREIY